MSLCQSEASSPAPWDLRSGTETRFPRQESRGTMSYSVWD